MKKALNVYYDKTERLKFYLPCNKLSSSISGQGRHEKSWHSQTRLVCDRCCVLVNSFLNQVIVTTCPQGKLAPVYPICLDRDKKPIYLLKITILLYKVCPKSIRPAFIPSRQSARAASAGYERNQSSLTNSLNAVVTGRTPWVARSVCLCPTCFFRSSHSFTIENDRKNRSTNLYQVLLQSRQELYGDDWNDTEGLCGRKYGHNTDNGVVQAV